MVTPMTIDDITRPPGRSVEFWRGTLHDMIDEMLDRLLEEAGDAPERGVDDRLDDERLDHELPDELPDDELLDDELPRSGWPGEEDAEPPGARPSVQGIAETGTQLRASFGAVLDQGTRVWGCDGTLRWTRAWANRFGILSDRFANHYRRSGLHCDCEVLRKVLGRTDLRPRCPFRPAPEDRPDQTIPGQRGSAASESWPTP